MSLTANRHSSQNVGMLTRLWCWCGIVLFCLLGAWPAGVWSAERSRISLLQIQADQGALYLNAGIELVLPDVVQEALHKGIALHFNASAEIERVRWYWFDAVDAQESKSVRLTFQPLLQRYRVTIGGLGQTFATLPEALNFVGHISHWRIADADVLNSSGDKKLVFIFELDRSRLPRLFQVGVADQEEWGLSLKQEVDLQISGGGQ